MVNLKNANLQQALLQEANLEYAILNGANLVSSNLILTSFLNSDLQNANLTNALITYESATPDSKTVYDNSNETPATDLSKVDNIPAPDIIETTALANAVELYELNKTGFIKLNGAKINGNTNGIDRAWAVKNGALFISSASTPKPAVKVQATIKK